MPGQTNQTVTTAFGNDVPTVGAGVSIGSPASDTATLTQGVGPADLIINDRIAANSDAGHWVDQLGGAVFFGASDSTRQLGYNVNTGGGPRLTSAPALYDQWESDYFQGGTEHFVERHIDFVFKTNGATTIAVGSNGQVNPQATINVVSTAGFASFGTITIATTGGNDTINYTGITGTSFTGCTGGTHGMVTGQAVNAVLNIIRPLMIQISRDTGLVGEFSMRHTSLTLVDWVTNQTYMVLGRTAVAMSRIVGADNTFTIGAAAARLSAFIMEFGAATVAQFSTQSAAIFSLAIGGAANTYWFTSRGMSINVQDNTAALTVMGAALGPLVQFRQGATAGAAAHLTQWQETGGATHIKITQATSAIAASLVIGKATLATTATDGFVYIPTCAGPPTGVPTAFTGTVPVIYDSTNNFLYINNGGWKKSTVYA